MKSKVLGAIFGISLFFLIILVWRFNNFFGNDRVHQAEVQSRIQISAVQTMMNVEFKNFQKNISYYNELLLRPENIPWVQLSPYISINKIEQIERTWSIKEFAIKEKQASTISWNREYLEKLILPVLPVETKGDAKDPIFYVSSFREKTGSRFVIINAIFGNKGLSLIADGDLFLAGLDLIKNSQSSLSIVNTKGMTVAHSIGDYLGTAISDNPIWEDVLSAKSLQGMGVYKFGKGQNVLGSYERIPNSNLYVISSLPMEQILNGRMGMTWELVLLGLGILLIATAIISQTMNFQSNKENSKSLVNSKIELEVVDLKKSIEPLVSSTNTIAKKDTDQISIENFEKQRLDLYRKVALTVTQELKAPLNAIIGYGQLLVAEAPNRKFLEQLEAILREARQSKEVMDKLLSFVGEVQTPKSRMKLETPLLRAIKNLEGKLKTKGVKIEKNIESDSLIELSNEALVKVFEDIMTNSIESMERMSNKLIIISLKEKEDKVLLSIKDTGEGIDSKTLEKVFDPFFTTKPIANHLGMGLSTALGILKDHHAEIKIESEKGKGTSVNIEFSKLRKHIELDSLMPPSKKEIVSQQIDTKLVNESDEEIPPPFNLSVTDLDTESTLSVPSRFGFQNISDFDSILELPPLPEIDDEQINFIEAPSESLKKKRQSELDEYTVEIRRPNPRL